MIVGATLVVARCPDDVRQLATVCRDNEVKD